MPIPFMQPIMNIVDCIHNATKAKNQDEISFPGRKPEPSVEKFCRKIPRCVRDKGVRPDSRAGSFPRPPGERLKGRESSAEKIAVLFSGKPLVQGELEEFSFSPAFSLTAPQGHHILYA